jgi:hypothetical protein
MHITNNIFYDIDNDRSIIRIDQRNADFIYAENTVIANNLFLNCRSQDFSSANAFPRRHKVYNNIFINNRDYLTGEPNLPIHAKDNLLDMRYNYFDQPCPETPGSILCGPGNIVSAELPFADTTGMQFLLDPCSPAVNGGLNQIIGQLGLLTDQAGEPRIQAGVVDIGPLETPALQLAAPAVVTPACHGPTGAVSFELRFACPPLSYAWTNGQASGTGASALEAGTYEFTITDSRGRSLLTDVTVPGSAPVLTLYADTLLCQDMLTDISSTVQTAVSGPVQYLWSNGAQQPIVGSAGPGWYALTVTDAAGCTAAQSILIAAALPLQSEVFTAPASGPSAPDGGILVNIQSGTPPYVLLWSTGDTSAWLNGVPPGNYQLTVTDGAGCAHLFLIQLGFVSATADPDDPASGVSVLPNPASDHLMVRPGAFTRFLLFDEAGRLLRSAPLQGLTRIDLAGLPAGAYVCLLSRSDGTASLVVSRLVISR